MIKYVIISVAVWFIIYAGLMLLKFGDFQVTTTGAFVIATAAVLLVAVLYALDERGKDS